MPGLHFYNLPKTAMKLSRLSHPFIAELKRYVANQKSNLSPVIMSVSDIVNKRINTTAISSHQNNNGNNIYSSNRIKEIYEKQKKLSEVVDMINAAYVFHRCIQEDEPNLNQAVKRDNIMSLLLGDYLLAQSSVDLADIRYPETVGLIAKGLEDFTRGEMMRLEIKSKTREELNMDLYAELTCGSLLAHACRSTAIIAGTNLELQNLVFNFGLNVGTAHRLIECCFNSSTPITSSTINANNLSNIVNYDKDKLKTMAEGRLTEAIGILFNMPNVEERLNLENKLNEMMNTCR